MHDMEVAGVPSVGTHCQASIRASAAGKAGNQLESCHQVVRGSIRAAVFRSAAAVFVSSLAAFGSLCFTV